MNSMPAADSIPSRPTRRQFLRLSGAVCAGLTMVPSRVIGAAGQGSPGQKLTLAGIGVGGVGHGQLRELAGVGFQIAALCDVDQEYAKKTYDVYPQARRYRDFRELLDSEGDKIDAVYCGTPDHTHAIIALAALKKKKHLCCVKPLTRTVHELRAVVETARVAGVATQVTAAPNTTESGCRTCELLDAGVLGAVRELHVWSNRPVWPQGMERPEGEDPVPRDFDWKLWLGPAPARPFKRDWPPDHYALRQMNLKDWNPGIRGVYHPFNFRGWWDFGTGALGDMGCHHFNSPFRALKLGAPNRLQASTSKVFAESAPLASMVTFDFPARNGLAPVCATWYDGGLRPAQRPEFGSRPWPTEGALYVGEKGCLLDTWEGLAVAPQSAARQAEDVPCTLPRRGGTWSEFYDACLGKEKAGCNFDLAGPLTETVLLGNAAIRSGKALQWDTEAMRFTNAEEAKRFIKEDYQNGWSL